MIDWNQAIDFYCERTSVGFWAEPLNAISNLSFVFAGIYGIKNIPTNNSRWLKALSLLAICVGIGSFLFHTFANKWSHLADIIPIGIFMATFIGFTANKIFKQGPFQTLMFVLAFIVLSVLVERYQPRHLLNGSLGYVHGITALIILSAYLRRISHPLTKYFLTATLIFSTSLIFRTIDHNVCSWLSVGTHFLWHTFNGLLMYVLLKSVIHCDTSDAEFADS